MHFKFYLVTEIRRSNLDPVDVMEMDELNTVMGRSGLPVPPQINQSEAHYYDNLQKVPNIAFVWPHCINLHFAITSITIFLQYTKQFIPLKNLKSPTEEHNQLYSQA